MIILCKWFKVFRSPDEDTDYFEMVAGVLQGDPYLFNICLDYVLRTSIDKINENGFKLTKERSRRYSAKTINDADYADDTALLANAPAQAETRQHNLERAAADISLHVNAHKTEYICFNQTGDISTLNGSTLKLEDNFTYLGSSVSPTEKDINLRHRQLSIVFWSCGCKTWPIKWNAVIVSILLYGCSLWTLTKRMEKKLRRQLLKNAACNIERVLETTPHKAAAIRPHTTHHENYQI